MAGRRTLRLRRGNARYELRLQDHGDGSVRLTGTRDDDALPHVDADIARRGAEILVQTPHGTKRCAAVQTPEGIWASCDGRTAFFAFEREDHVAADSAADELAVRAPMTGVLVDVRAAEGDEVAEGQLLGVLEAMKMEYRIEAPGDAVVERVEAEAGQNVDLDQPLFDLRALEGEEAT
ncbi:MAG: acetyl-CoA carboxylase biotin carboxyl carrier protein subunit [Candidatus Bipolaricaulia bacterium]